jgi:hypothetical protein
MTGVLGMQAIRIEKESWGKVWRTLVASGPISRLGQEPVYLVSDQQVRLLEKKKLPFKIVPLANGQLSEDGHG